MVRWFLFIFNYKNNNNVTKISLINAGRLKYFFSLRKLFQKVFNVWIDSKRFLVFRCLSIQSCHVSESCHCDLLFFNKTFLLVFPVGNWRERNAVIFFSVWHLALERIQFSSLFCVRILCDFFLLQNSVHFSLLIIISDCDSRLRVHTLFVACYFWISLRKVDTELYLPFECHYLHFALTERLICMWKCTSLNLKKRQIFFIRLWMWYCTIWTFRYK